MKLLFDVKNDFDSLYYLPGYYCKVHVVVKDGIVELNIEDDFGDKADTKYDYEDEDWDEWEEYKDKFDELVDEDLVVDFTSPYGYYDCEHWHDEDDVVEEPEDEKEHTISVEENFVNDLRKVDTDGTLTKLLIDLIKNGNVGDTTSKSGRAFERIVKNIAKLIKEKN